jgi:hypothetical protein
MAYGMSTGIYCYLFFRWNIRPSRLFVSVTDWYSHLFSRLLFTRQSKLVGGIYRVFLRTTRPSVVEVVVQEMPKRRPSKTAFSTHPLLSRSHHQGWSVRSCKTPRPRPSSNTRAVAVALNRCSKRTISLALWKISLPLWKMD